MSRYQRIACLSTESVETLYARGAGQFIAAIPDPAEVARWQAAQAR